MFKSSFFYAALLIYPALVGCSSAATDTNGQTGEAGTPVTITHIANDSLEESVELNATSVFQLKTFIKANATGYLQTVHAQVGKFINKGEEVFTIKTKEAEALGNTINALDSSFRFTGIIHIRCPGSGYVTTLNYKAGDYVQDGEQLAVVSEKSSFVFLLYLPYELKPYLADNKNVVLRLPDGTQLNGYTASLMPSVDAASQTQGIAIKVNTGEQIPEGLIAKVAFVKKLKTNARTLPKAAVLTDEVQSRFWVMKLIDSTTAVKIPVQKGLENNNRVEILSPIFSPEDKILLTGNYGLADTAKVMIIP